MGLPARYRCVSQISDTAPALWLGIDARCELRQSTRRRVVPVSFNAGGWRDLPRVEDKAEGVVRVLVLGDFFMEAYSVRFEDSLPARLERLTNRAERQVEVINLGVGGYGTLQEYLVFDAIGRAFYRMWSVGDVLEKRPALELANTRSRTTTYHVCPWYTCDKTRVRPPHVRLGQELTCQPRAKSPLSAKSRPSRICEPGF